MKEKHTLNCTTDVTVREICGLYRWTYIMAPNIGGNHGCPNTTRFNQIISNSNSAPPDPYLDLGVNPEKEGEEKG